MVENLRLLFWDVPTVQIDRYGSLRNWIHEASNEKYWCQLVERLLHPSTPLPDCPDGWGPLPSWQARRAAAEHQQTNDPPDSDDDTFEDDTGDDQHTPPQSPPPRPCRPPPPPRSHLPPRIQLMMMYMIQNAGSTTLPSAPWSVTACHTP